MDSNLLMLSFFFGLVGTGMLMYGKRAGRPIPLLAGVALIAIPYFIPNLIAMLIVCTAVTITPWFLRHA